MASPFDLHKFDLQPWCSLLPYLFIIVVEALNVANKNAMKSSLVEGIVLPRWDSWHNNDQYGDDACFTTWVIEIRIQAWHAGAAEEPIWVGWRTFNAYGYNTWTLASYLALFFFAYTQSANYQSISYQHGPCQTQVLELYSVVLGTTLIVNHVLMPSLWYFISVWA